MLISNVISMKQKCPTIIHELITTLAKRETERVKKGGIYIVNAVVGEE